MSKLDRFLHEGHPENVIPHIGKLGNPYIVAKALGHHDREVFIRAAKRLSKIGGPESRRIADTFAKDLVHSDPDKVAVAALFLNHYGDPNFLSQLESAEKRIHREHEEYIAKDVEADHYGSWRAPHQDALNSLNNAIDKLKLVRGWRKIKGWFKKR
ncbi:MAG TPA: HEAT repeat domain-containing protein [Candidatus Norongarragalinales archaeon]|jgi:hypothetical protein|nr:HEAT repeat domain-containing protein [Candidatus Norongarragalinales archaeon]